MSKEESLDVAAAAERHDCSTKPIWRRIKNGTLPARTEKIASRDGRPILKTLIRVSDLDDAFGRTRHEDHVRSIRASAQPLTAVQKRALGQVLLDHIRDRKARMGRSIDREHA